MYLSVIIPTCNRYDLLKNCLDNLSPQFQSIDSSLYEIIVTDDSKNNSELELVKKAYSWVNFVVGPKKGPAANRNNGAKYAKGDWIIFIDDDCLPDKEILRSYYIEIEKGIYKGIEGYINADRAQKRFDEQSPLNLVGGCFWSCNIAVEKKIYNRLGGFDEGFPFPALEDTDFYNRLKEVTKTGFLEKAKVIHPWRRPKPWQNYKKWISCHEYAIAKSKTPKNIKYRIKRIKLFITVFINDTMKLIKFRFKGFLFYIEVIWCSFLMIFK
jgi:GT2 family glycosyltransferase